MKILRRPIRSVIRPKNSAPTTSPTRYTEPSAPTSALEAQVGLEAGLGDDLDLQAVEDPGDPQADHDQPVEPRPGQPVQPGRDQAADGFGGLLDSGCSGHGSPLQLQRPLAVSADALSSTG